MKYASSGSINTVKVNFIVDEVDVTPTSATYSVYNNANAVVSGLSDQAITITGSSCVISVPALANTRTLPLELRRVEVKFVSSGVTYITNYSYFLRDNVFFPATPDEVRAILGVSTAELPDSYIDILSAYDEVTTESTLDTASIITSGDSKITSLIQCVLYKAAMTTLSALRSSLFKMEQADNTLYERFDNFDYEGVGVELRQKYTLYLLRLKNEQSSSLFYSSLGYGADPITGV